MSAMSSANTIGITTAVMLSVSKPTADSFHAFFREWVETNLVQSDGDVVQGSLSEWISRGVSWATTEAVVATADIQMVNAGVCHVATATIPHNDEWIELVFVGVAGTWHFLPREVLENGKIVAGSVGISLAVLSIVQALYRAGRFLTRR
eukprot:m.180154 g.180154  ORF g.180154 m.180154 type:complete len:149 (+) comp14941_c0_seq1:187-633(+)